MELNREQIVKALECCSDCDCYNAVPQENCPLVNMPFCKNYLRKQALALIRELTEEKEKLGIENFDLICELSRIKEETVRKMQERLKEYLDDFYNSGEDALLDVPGLIDQTAKELLEEGSDDA